MKILKVDFCDLIVWTTKEMGVLRIHYDEEFFKEIYPRLLQGFYKGRD